MNKAHYVHVKVSKMLLNARFRLELSRQFSTKGRKKTRRLEAVKREVRRKTPPQLPWWVHKEEPDWLKELANNKEFLTELFDASKLAVKELLKVPVYRPLDDELCRLNQFLLDIERHKFIERVQPRFIRQFQDAFLAFAKERDQQLMLRGDDQTPALSQNPIIIKEAFRKSDANSIISEPIRLNDKLQPKEHKFQPSSATSSKDPSIETSITNSTRERLDFTESSRWGDLTPSKLMNLGIHDINFYFENVGYPWIPRSLKLVERMYAYEQEKLETVRTAIAQQEKRAKEVQNEGNESITLSKLSVPTETLSQFKTELESLPSYVSIPDLIEQRAGAARDIAWHQYLNAIRLDKSEDIKNLIKRLDEKKSPVSGFLAARLVHSLIREDWLDDAWEAFRDVTSMRNIWTPVLIDTGIHLCGMRGKAERALQYFELGELHFGKAFLPMFLPTIMKACSKSRGMTQYTFEYYDEMTKVHFLKPNTEIFVSVLTACSVLGDVVRAEELWVEITQRFGVVPNEECFYRMLLCYSTANSMLRARKLRKESVKVLTFQDKALLATAAGLTAPKIDRTDEAKRVLRELEYDDPRVLEGDFSDPVKKLREKRARLEAQGLLDDDEINGSDNDPNDDEDEVPELSDSAKMDRQPMVAKRYIGQIYENVKKLSSGIMDTHLPIPSTTAKDVFKPENTAEGHLALSEPMVNGQRQESNIQAANKMIMQYEYLTGAPAPLKLRNAHLKVIASALRLHRAGQYVEEMEAVGVQPDLPTYNILIAMFARANRVSKVLDYLDKVREKMPVDKLTIGPVIDVLARNGEHNKAIRLYKEYQHLDIMEKHIRYLRVKVKGTPLDLQLPEDPNYWRSRDNIGEMVKSIPRYGPGRKVLDWMNAQGR